jgi:eukaryotic-like serine/threonine-protein kinase
MTTPPSDSNLVYRFADLTLDPAQRQVLRAGRSIELNALNFDLLRTLAEAAPAIVSADDLAEHVWGRHFVSPENIAQRVMLLRQSLEDRAQDPRYVETVRNKGYRLVPPVERAVVPRRRSRRHWRAPAGFGLTTWLSMGLALLALGVVLGIATLRLLERDDDVQWLRAELIPLVEAHLAAGDWEAAYGLVRHADARLPDHPELLELWLRLSWLAKLESDPPGAVVYRRGYAATDEDWEELGRTPVEVRIPFGLSRLRFELEGYVPVLRTLGGGVIVTTKLESQPEAPDLIQGHFRTQPEVYKLDTPDSLREGMVRVPGWSAVLDDERVQFRDFFLSRHEVTNAEFRKFVEAGGYHRPELWDPVVLDGEALPWEEAMAMFTDRTGRRGPSTWAAGDYPDGQEDFPVSGVSWYEARAYARFVEAELPTARHWLRAMPPGELPWLLPSSNLDSPGPRTVGETQAMNFSGTFDMVGNVREWTVTPRQDEFLILGGGWSDGQSIARYTEYATAPPLDRSPTNGLRLAITDDEPTTAARAQEPIPLRPLPEVLPPPVNDDVYAAYTRSFDYPRGPLNAAIEDVETTRAWVRQRVTFDAAYGGERMVAYIYLPRLGTPPYQTVIYWPGSAAVDLDSIDDYSRYLDFLVSDGRAVIFPVYKGTFERGDRSPLAPAGSMAYAENLIAGVKDLRRSIDYLESRDDIDHEALAFFGHSWGGLNGPVVLAQEPRLSVAILYVPNLRPMLDTPEVSPVHALPRVRIPTLVLSSEFDSVMTLEESRQLFDLLGTPATDKKLVVAPGGHFVPRDMLIRHTLDWLDEYFGATER